MECSGNFTASSGTCNVDFGAGMLIGARLNITGGTFTGEAGASFIVTGSSGGENMTFDDSTFTGDSTTNILINNGTTSVDWYKANFYAGNMIIGSGTLRSISENDNKCANLTIASGGIFEPQDDEISVAGDFTTSGGLLGASCFHGDNNHFIQSDAAIPIGSNTATYETWFRATADSGYVLMHQDGSKGFYSRFDGSNLNFHFFSTGSSVFSDVSGLRDSKWHHMAIVINDTDYKLYIDGKLNQHKTGLASFGNPNTTFKAGGTVNYFEGQLDEIRIFDDVRTESEIRANMFTESPSGDNLLVHYKLNEGTGTTVDDATGSYDAKIYNATSGSAEASWAGAGNFDKGSSTLVMAKSGTQNIYYKHVEAVNNLTINDGSTTQLWNTEAAGNGLLDIEGNLTVNEKLKSHADKAQSRIRFTTAGTTIAVGSDVKTTALSELYSMELEHSGSTNIPELTTPRLFLDSTATAVATGDLTLTTELEVNSGTTFNANGNTIACKALDVNGGTLDLSNSIWNFSVTSSGDDLSLSTSSTLLTGNTTLSGHSSATPTPTTMGSAGNFEVVGNVSNLALQGGGDLTVIGSVTNCTLADSTANIRQWHHTLDTQQLLDADEAGDDDLRLTKPALDNALELMTK